MLGSFLCPFRHTFLLFLPAFCSYLNYTLKLLGLLSAGRVRPREDMRIYTSDSLLHCHLGAACVWNKVIALPKVADLHNSVILGSLDNLFHLASFQLRKIMLLPSPDSCTIPDGSSALYYALVICPLISLCLWNYPEYFMYFSLEYQRNIPILDN